MLIPLAIITRATLCIARSLLRQRVRLFLSVTAGIVSKRLNLS